MKRPRYEINALMNLFKRFLKSELDEMIENGIRFQVIGRINKLPEDVQRMLDETIEKTSRNSDMVEQLIQPVTCKKTIDIRWVVKIGNQRGFFGLPNRFQHFYCIRIKRYMLIPGFDGCLSDFAQVGITQFDSKLWGEFFNPIFIRSEIICPMKHRF